MADLKDILYYLIKSYPYKDDLSNARITKMIYLSDWHSAVIQGKQLSNILWYFNNYGPFVHDIEETIQANPELFSTKYSTNWYGTPKTSFFIKDDSYVPNLSKEDIEIINRVILVTKDKTWDQFITFVYSTYPIINSTRYTTLNLVDLAREYISKKNYQ